MKLRCKFILAIGAILTLSYGVLLFYTSILQDRLIIGQAKQQARMLHKQIQLTRQWVADHHGLFVIKTDKDTPNPFLDDPLIRASNGEIYVKRNPAMVTRELSEYANREGFCWFRVTSLRPVNPENVPDDFERHSLLMFQEGIPEIIKITSGKHGRVLRYVAPLKVRESCIPCHARHGYSLGDIRGALSISIPIAWADKAIAKNNRSVLIFGLLSVMAVAVVLYLLFTFLVARPIDRLSRAMDKYPDENKDLSLPHNNDEIGILTSKFIQLCSRLQRSQLELDTAKEQAFRNEKLASLGQLTAGIAHEINNPLGGMLNCVKTMQEEPENLELHKRYLPLLDKGLRRMEHTMRQLLNFGRTEPLRLYKIDIDEAIRECFELLEYRLKNIDLQLNLQLNEEYCIDLEALRQIIINISLNAIQAMPDGGILTVTSLEHEGQLILMFEDTGTGIPPEIMNRIFDPFFTTKDVGEGTGLGLAVCHTLIQKLGGHIDVESTQGMGSCFVITLPVKENCPVGQPQLEHRERNSRQHYATGLPATG